MTPPPPPPPLCAAALLVALLAACTADTDPLALDPDTAQPTDTTATQAASAASLVTPVFNKYVTIVFRPAAGLDTTGWHPFGKLSLHNCIEEQRDSTSRRWQQRQGENPRWFTYRYLKSRTIECEHSQVFGWGWRVTYGAFAGKRKAVEWERRQRVGLEYPDPFYGEEYRYYQRIALPSATFPRRKVEYGHLQSLHPKHIVSSVPYFLYNNFVQYLGGMTYDGQYLPTMFKVRGGWFGGGERGEPEGTTRPGLTAMLPDTIYLDVEGPYPKSDRIRVDVRFPLDARRTGWLRWGTEGALPDLDSVSLKFPGWPHRWHDARTLRLYVPGFRGWGSSEWARGPSLSLAVRTDTVELSSGDGWGVAGMYDISDQSTTPVIDAVHWRHQPDQEEEEEEEEEDDNTQYETPWLQLDRWTNEADSVKIFGAYWIYADGAAGTRRNLADDVAGPGPWELPAVPTEADSVRYWMEIYGYFHHGLHGFDVRETLPPNTMVTARWFSEKVTPPGTDFCPSSGSVQMRSRPVLVVHADTLGAATGELCVRTGNTAVHLVGVRAGVKKAWMLPEGITSVTARNWTRPSGAATGWVFADVELSRWAPPGWMAGSREIMVLPAPGN